MNPVVVSNSTPLIALGSIGRFSALRELFTQIHIPEAVLNTDLLLIDDKDGRKIAESAGITCVGTVILLLRYYRLDTGSFTAALDELIAKGFRLAPKEYRKIVQLALQRSGKGGANEGQGGI